MMTVARGPWTAALLMGSSAEGICGLWVSNPAVRLRSLVQPNSRKEPLSEIYPNPSSREWMSDGGSDIIVWGGAVW